MGRLARLTPSLYLGVRVQEEVAMADESGAAQAGGNGGNSAGRGFDRFLQTFPQLTERRNARRRRFGEIRTFKDGECLFETGKPGPGMYVVLAGHVIIPQRDGLGNVTPVTQQAPGQFLA